MSGRLPKPLRALVNLLRYGPGEAGRARKRAARRAAKERQFAGERWQHEGDFARRRYDSYAAYRAHQASKLDGIIDRLRETAPEEIHEFLERFEHCEALRGAHSVLCLGARLGTEVEALQRLGKLAIGIDLNPGPENPRVLHGDFHKLVFPDACVDAVYTNSLDHVFDLDAVVSEASRVIRPGGVLVVDVEVGFEEGHVPGDYEATHWRDADVLVERIAEVGGLVRESARELGATRRGRRRQVVLRKAAPASA